MNEFIINDFLTLKLEEGKTNIYVNGELFEQCKFLMLNIPVEETEKFDEIDSIDEVADLLGWREEGQEGIEYEIRPETEFWGHCSNLQAWYENNYDTRLLHSNLTFPLLKHLTHCGDPLAKKVFKEEIAKRIESGYLPVISYLIEENYLRFLSPEEFNIVITSPSFSKILTMSNAWDVVYLFHDLFDSIKGSNLLKENFSELLTLIEKIQNAHDQYDAFTDLLAAIEGSEVLKENIIKLFNTARKLRDNDYKGDLIKLLSESIKKPT